MDGWIPQVIWECCWNDQKRVRAKDGRARVSWAFDSFGWNSAFKSKCENRKDVQLHELYDNSRNGLEWMNA